MEWKKFRYECPACVSPQTYGVLLFFAFLLAIGFLLPTRVFGFAPQLHLNRHHSAAGKDEFKKLPF